MSQTPKGAAKKGLGRGLGRGFEALLPPDFDKAQLLLAPEDRIERLSVSALSPNPYQPRKHFDQTALEELAASIKQYGIVQPLVVSPVGNGSYTLIAGERRWRAAQVADLTQVPCIVRTGKELEQLEVAILENVQRVDLSPLEQAVSIERWHEQFSVAYDTIAKRLGKAPSTINNIVRLLQLPVAAREALVEGLISEGHARAILSLKEQPALQDYLLESIQNHGWSVRQAERYVTSVKAGVSDKVTVHERVQTETPATKQLSQKLGTPVNVRRTARGGRLEISFKTDEELERLIHLFD